MSLSFVCDGDVVGRPQAPGVWGPVPPAGLEPATYRLEGVPGRALCRFEEYQGFLGRGTSFGATVSVLLPRPLRRGGPGGCCEHRTGALTRMEALAHAHCTTNHGGTPLSAGGADAGRSRVAGRDVGRGDPGGGCRAGARGTSDRRPAHHRPGTTPCLGTRLESRHN